MTDLDKEIEGVLATQGEWKGSPEEVWQRVEGKIRRRQQRKKWQLSALGASVAAAVLVAVLGTKGLNLATIPNRTPPAGTDTVELPPVFAPPVDDPANHARANPLFNTLPGFLSHAQVVLVGQVVSETDIELPPTADQWQTYYASQTPPPPDHPKAQGWRPPEPPSPTPAKVFTIQVTEGTKGIATGATVTMQQLNVTYANGGPEPLLRLGEQYLLFPRETKTGSYEVGAPYVTLREDGRLHVVTLSQGVAGYLQELDGAETAPGLAKVRFAVRAEAIIGTALGKVGLQGADGEPPSGVPFDMVHFPRFVGTRSVCTETGTGVRGIASYESSVWPQAAGVHEVRLIRRVSLAGQDHETKWVFQVEPDGSVGGPVRSGSDLSLSRCPPRQ
jgi:hypothetical protein